MIFCHIIADYNLQGWLASAKQKEWWLKNAPDRLYRYDYIVALICHSFSWTFVLHIPVFFYMQFLHIQVPVGVIIIMFAWNIFMHAAIDNEKANNKSINLLMDQICHIAQVVGTFAVYASL